MEHKIGDRVLVDLEITGKYETKEGITLRVSGKSKTFDLGIFPEEISENITQNLEEQNKYHNEKEPLDYKVDLS